MNQMEIAEMVELVEARAYDDWYRSIPENVACEMGASVPRYGSSYALLMREVPAPLFNRSLGLGVGREATEEEVDETVRLYRDAGLTALVQVSPLSRPAGIGAWLEARGARLGSNWVKMYRSTENPPEVSTGLRIEVIGSEAAWAFGEIASSVFDMPATIVPALAASVGRTGWRHYIAYDGDSPVAVAALFVDGDAGWLGIGATLPTHRNRGAQSALMARRIRDAGESGCRWAVTETGEETPERPNPSYHNMVRTGFLLAYPRPNYVIKPLE